MSKRSGSMTVMLVAGARPNFMKIAPVQKALDRGGHRTVIVHTGQHYDDRMSASFFRDLDIREPDHHLGVGSATHAVQTARVMEAFEPILLETRPDWVLVPGAVMFDMGRCVVEPGLLVNGWTQAKTVMFEIDKLQLGASSAHFKVGDKIRISGTGTDKDGGVYVVSRVTSGGLCVTGKATRWIYPKACIEAAEAAS